MKKFTKIFSRACVCFTIAEFALLAIASVMLNGGLKSDTVSNFLNLKGALSIFAVAFVFCALSLIFEIKSLPKILCRLIHYIVSFLCVFVLFVVLQGDLRSSYIFVVTVLFTAAYIIIMLISFIIHRIFDNRDKDEYTPVFDEADK